MIAAGDLGVRALYRDSVRRLPPAVRTCGSPSQAEDVVQDVFVAVIDDPPGIVGADGVLAWLPASRAITCVGGGMPAGSAAAG
jgi:DNA-directed RNA polymerase specialized sigma24 family protein